MADEENTTTSETTTPEIPEELAEKVTALRAIADVDDADSVLLAYLDQAKYVILNRMWPYLTDEEYEELDVPHKFVSKQIRIACYLINKRGAEGETQHIENGIHRNYKSSDVPENMLQDVLPMVGIPR